jgi:Uma2 family endonuclease
MGLLHARPKQFTIGDYYKMFDSGVFDGIRVELMEGTVVEMSPHNLPHSHAVTLLNPVLVGLFPHLLVRVQLPFEVSNLTEPEPDFAIVTREAMREARRHPTQAELIIEVSDTSLDYDRGDKALRYAQAGVPEYWILNLPDQQLECYRRPFPGGYRETQILKAGDTITPLCRPQEPLAVETFFPKL